MLLDAKNRDEVSDRICSKVVIVGAGAVGLMMAVSFARAGVPVVVLEAGGRVADTSRNGQTAVSLGKAHNGVLLGRAFGLGGTSVLWGGQLAEFEPADLVRNGSRWPLTYTELQPWYEWIYRFLAVPARLPAARYRERLGGETEAHKTIERFFTYWLPQPNFANLFRREIVSSPIIRIIINATVNDITFAGTRAEAVRAAVPGQREIVISGDNFVFAAGTIENVRFFLSTQRSSSVPWKTNKNVGTFFQDHLAGKIANVEVLNEKRFREFFENGYVGRLKLQPKLRFTERARKEACVGVCGSFSFDSRVSENLSNVKALLRSLKSGSAFSKLTTLPADVRALGRIFVPLLVRYIRDRRIFALFDRSLDFHVQAEQVPIANSSIRLLGAMPEPDGLFRVGVDWRLDGREMESIDRFAKNANAYLESRGIARLRVDEELLRKDAVLLSRLSDTYHQCGGLRMADSPGTGVVDPNCRVWGTKNAFVGGASVFPSSSYANSTLTSLALAARLVSTIRNLKCHN